MIIIALRQHLKPWLSRRGGQLKGLWGKRERLLVLKGYYDVLFDFGVCLNCQELRWKESSAVFIVLMPLKRQFSEGAKET